MKSFSNLASTFQFPSPEVAFDYINAFRWLYGQDRALGSSIFFVRNSVVQTELLCWVLDFWVFLQLCWYPFHIKVYPSPTTQQNFITQIQGLISLWRSVLRDDVVPLRSLRQAFQSVFLQVSSVSNFYNKCVCAWAWKVNTFITIFKI